LDSTFSKLSAFWPTKNQPFPTSSRLRKGLSWPVNGMLALCLLSIVGCALKGSQHPVTVLSYNIRYDNPGDSLDAWPNRSQWVASILKESDASIFGLQEALKHQIDDIQSEMNRFFWVGVGRDDGVAAGEYSPVFYDPTIWTVIQWETRWLSPDSSAVGQAGWDAALPRIATVVDFARNLDDGRLRVINTHFDHRGVEARRESAKLIRRWAQETGGNVVVMGDFNVEPTDSAYTSIVESGDLIDVAASMEAGAQPTFLGFDASNTSGPRIDYLFVSNGILVRTFDVISEVRNGRYPSDHAPIVSRITF